MKPDMDIPILMYHDVEPGAAGNYAFSLPLRQFQDQLDELQRQGFETISFRELFAALDGSGSLPVKPVILTFDDAYASIGSYGVPLLLERGMKGTIFVVADAVGGCNHWDMERGAKRMELMNQGMLERAIAGGMEIGAHGCAHLNLEELDEAGQLDEIVRSKAQLGKLFGIEVNVFAYPYGAHNSGVADMVKAAGYQGAVSIFSPEPSVTSNRWRMRRVFPHRRDGKWRFRLKLSPLYLRMVALRERWRLAPAERRREGASQ
jgi:peptidoglycan/xylan/chitin deacetylase (PgdA/CDA1 family)